MPKKPLSKLNLVNYLLVQHKNKAAAIPILVVYFLLFILMTVCFIRLVHITVTDPPYVPLGSAALRDREVHKKGGRAALKTDEIAMGEYKPGGDSGSTSPEFKGPDSDPDSPGLELFYTKDVYVCSTDGRPIWCSECCNWCVAPIT
jgi:palmitoyltransferase